MGWFLTEQQADILIEKVSEKADIYAPMLFAGEGRFSETDVIRYGVISKSADIVFDKKSEFSFKEALLPINSTVLYFTEDRVSEPGELKRDRYILVRSCDMNAVKRLDQIYLDNKFADFYYARNRARMHFILIGCKKSFENCFCVSMGTNTCTGYEAYAAENNREFYISGSGELDGLLRELGAKEGEQALDSVSQNHVSVSIPEKLDSRIAASSVWEEYSKRCIGCGRCNFICPTCTCFTSQDLFYKDNANVGERKRVWASCMVDGYTDIAGGMSFRKTQGDRMRFKVMHKIHDFKERFGYQMCVGCGRCDDVCPEYISFSNCVNKLAAAMEEVEANEK